jgi:hypothetical protein
MIGILLFLLLFYLLCNAVFAQLVPEVPPPIVPEEVGVNELVDFSGMFDTLLEVFASFFVQYYGYLIGLFIAFLFWGYIQGILERKKERLLREQAEQQAVRVEQENRLRMVKRAEDKRLSRERELIRKYTHASDEKIERIQWAMHQETKGDDKELRLAPRDPSLLVDKDVFRYSGKVVSEEYNVGLCRERENYEYGGRGATYFRADGSQEGSVYPVFDDKESISKYDIVTLRYNQRPRYKVPYRRCGVECDDEGGGY